MHATRLLTLVSIVLLAVTPLAIASVPPMINYQGKLMQPNGMPVPDGEYAMTFAIYGQPTGGTALWSEVDEHVQVKGGLYSVLVGSVINLPANIFDAPDRFFGVKVGDDPEMTPRQQIASVGFAVKAGTADLATNVPDGTIVNAKLANSSVTAVKLADGSVTTDKVADGSLTAQKLAAGVATPAGTMCMFGGSSAPTGWLLCNGSAVSRTTYASLFAAIGTTFGTGNGSTTFNLPDFRGVFPKGAGTTNRSAGRDASGGYYAGVLGLYVQDHLQGHIVDPENGSARFVTQRPAFSYAGGLHFGGNQPAYSAGGDTGIDFPSGVLSSDGTNGTPRTGRTTEPQSLGVNYIIKY